MYPLACLPLLSLPLLLAAPAPSPSAGEIAARLQAGCGQIDTLEADFVQVLRSLSFGRPQEERGRLRLRRPARMRWDYTSPERKVAIVDGERSWLYVPDENQVIVGDLDEVKRGGAAGLLLAGEIDLARDFRIEAGALGPEPGQGSIALVPRQAGDEFSRLEVLVDLKTGLPARIEVHTALGEVMEYRFSRVRTGLPLPEALFHFEPPPGVEILRAE